MLEYGCQIKYKGNTKKSFNVNSHIFNFDDFEYKSCFEDPYLTGEFTQLFLYHTNLSKN